MGILFDAEKSMGRENPKRNMSACLDLTAYEAIKHADAAMERERLHRILDILHMVSELNDFQIEGRIVLKDKRTGKIWR